MSDIDELFARDPLHLTDEDLTALITHLRKLREQYTNKPPTQRSAAKKEVKPLPNATLEDLGL